MRTLIAALLLTGGLVVGVPTPAFADCQYGTDSDGGGQTIGGSCEEQDSTPGGVTPDGTYVPPTGPRPPVYEHYYTPACMVNGPPGQGSADALCMAAVSVCEAQGQPRGTLYMQHWRREVPGGTWESMGNECRGPGEPTREEPEVTQEMVLDEAYAAAPSPQARVQPGTRSYVNVPNNYYADAPDQTVDVTVLGDSIAVRFTVNEVTWDFGDGTSATGEGIKDADVGTPGAVEHAYTRQGSYRITATSTVGVSFTLPNGQAVNLPNAFSMPGEAVDLPVGEIQTRVDSTG
jgi:hypothetical protein